MWETSMADFFGQTTQRRAELVSGCLYRGREVQDEYHDEVWGDVVIEVSTLGPLKLRWKLATGRVERISRSRKPVDLIPIRAVNQRTG